MEYEDNARPETTPGKISGPEAITSHSPPKPKSTHVPGNRLKALSLSNISAPKDISSRSTDPDTSLPLGTFDNSNPRWAAVSRKYSSSAMEDAVRAEKRQRLNPLRPDIPDQAFAGSSQASQPDQIADTLSSRVSSYSSDVHTPRESRALCDNCSAGYMELPTFVKALLEVQMELNIINSDEVALKGGERIVSEVTKQGLAYGLRWSATELRKLLGHIQATGPATVHSRYLPPPNSRVASGATRQQEQLQLATKTHGSQHTPNITERPVPEAHSRRLSISQDRQSYTHESLPPIIPPDQMKRTRNYDQTPSASTASAYPSSGSSLYAPGYSPTQSHGVGRSLPSPPGMNAPPTSLPSPGTVAASLQSGAHSAHLQDLQHQISTKTLALQTLQREHDQLLAAFSRSQIRCSTLDKKSQVSDHEINNLTEEKIRLQQQVESLECNIEELTQARDDAQKQSTADGAQWRQILAMSSQLQKRSAEEAQEQKLAKDEWLREREQLQQHIRRLESGRIVVDGDNASPTPNTDGTLNEAGDDPSSSTSLETLRSEIKRLQRRCMELEAVLRDVTGETEQLGQAMRAMANIRARISGKSTENEDTT